MPNAMTPLRKARLCAIIFAAAALSLHPSFAPAQTQPSPQSLDGLWLSDGYGDLVEFQGDTLRVYEITKLSCIASDTATRKPASDPANETVFTTGDDVFRISAGPSADTRWFHADGSVSSVLLRRTSSRPESCRQQPLPDTPITNYQVFWETFSEQYPFFALRRMDWSAVDKKFRPQVTAQTTPDELFRILSDMVDPLHDAHTFINAKAIQKRFHGYRPSADPMQRKNAARITEIIETKYVLGGLRDFCNKQLQFGLLQTPPRSGGIGYLRIHSFNSYSRDQEFLKQLDALESALDDIFKDSAKLTGLVIDVRINTGGSDVFGVSIASRLATQEYLAYSKVIRNDIHDPDHRTPPQPVMVHVSSRPGFRGPVVLLTSADSVSAAETFTMALLDRHPHVIRIGANTQGVFSDVLGRKLPNGWRFGLPNEIYVTKDGKAFDGAGVPPDIEVPIFPAEDLTNGRDSALDKALEVLAHTVK
ncbi:MAG TPA: S41 family peptidase [Candidatus Angelobacter sp.]|nr:S41 family peptidase [Candidatus Angelobacter sp.]